MLDFQKQLGQKFKNKKICILGFDREGKSTLNFLRQYFPNKTIGIVDIKTIPINDNNISLHLGKNYLKSLKQYQVIFRTPGISIEKVKQFTHNKTIITSQTKLFFDLCPAKIIGITGTKGKSTTASLINHVLKSKFKTHLIGNIGYPPLDHLKHIDQNSKVVFELSSHQLSDLRQSPHIAVFLNLFPEHLDYYSSFTEYVKAKANITKFQTADDLLIFNINDLEVKKIAKVSQAKKISFSGKEEILSKLDSPLIGKFNLINIIPSIIIGKYFKIPEKTIIKSIKSFKPLANRLEKVGQYNGITFINDSLATIPEATIAAINSLEKEIGSLIVGGFDRGVKQDSLAKAIINSSIPTIILLPDTGKKIKSLINKDIKKEIKIFKASSMIKAVKHAFENTSTGKICLLSPGAASFNMFKDYQDRGNQFKQAVKKLHV